MLDHLNLSEMSNDIYKASCWDCDDLFIGKTKRRVHDRKVIKTPIRPSKIDDDVMSESSKIADRITMIEHNIKWDNFDIIASGTTDYHCK